MPTVKSTKRPAAKDAASEKKSTKSLGVAQGALQKESAKRERTYGKGDFSNRNKVESQVDRDKFVNENYDPTYEKFLKENFNVDVRDPKAVNYYAVRDLIKGITTKSALWMTVTPVSNGKTFNPIKVVASLRVSWPQTKDGKHLPIDDEHPAYFQTYPYREKVLPADFAADVEESVKTEKKPEDIKPVIFTEAQISALAGIGLNNLKLIPAKKDEKLSKKDEKARNSMLLPYELRKAIQEGYKFPYSGAVTLASGAYVNVAGIGQLKTSEDGLRAIAEVEPNTASVLGKDLVLDLNAIRHVPGMDIDIFERNAKGEVVKEVLKDENDKPIRDANGKAIERPVLSQQAKNLNDFGHSLEPMLAFKTDKSTKKTVATHVLVSVVNGGLCAVEMREVERKNPLNDTVTKELVPPLAHVSVRDGKRGVFHNSKFVEFYSVADEEGYRKGRGGMVVTKEGLRWAVPMPERQGFANVLDEKASKEIAVRYDMSYVQRRRSDYSMKKF